MPGKQIISDHLGNVSTRWSDRVQRCVAPGAAYLLPVEEQLPWKEEEYVRNTINSPLSMSRHNLPLLKTKRAAGV